MSQTSSPSSDASLMRDALDRLNAGDLSVRLPEDGADGVDAGTAAAFNRHVAMLGQFAAELHGVMQSTGTDCRYGAQMAVPDAQGAFAGMVQDVNQASADLTNQFRAVAHAVTAVANGDLSRLITTSAPGEMGEFVRTVNTMVHQLNGFAAELTRISREIGSVGRFGGQMETPGMTGTWRDLTDSVNLMSANLTNQVRDVTHTAWAAVENRPSRPTSCPAQGEMQLLFDYVDALADKRKV
jgi:methyl-accepting chemotaxis protein